MSNPHERHRNNLRMGIFVSAAILLALGVVVVLADVKELLTTRTTRYTVEFTLESGVTNLKRGSEVRLGGVRLGEVLDVKPRFVQPGEAMEHIDVEFRVNANVELYSDAQVLVSTPLIGAEAWLDIPTVGTPESGRPPGGHLIGADTVGMMTSMLGPRNAARADQMVENMRLLTAMLVADYEEHMRPTLADVRRLSGDAQRLVGRITDDDWPRWEQSIDELLRGALETRAVLNETIARAEVLLDSSIEIIGENREALRTLTTSAAEAAEKMNEIVEWVTTEVQTRVIAALDSGASALAHADEALAAIRREYETWATEIGVVLANSSHAAQQLKLAMTEIRRAPWKLIHVPSRQELEHELLYDTVRAFALAAGDLRTAAISVQRVLDTHGERLAADEEEMMRLRQQLFEPLERYEEAQRRLLNVLLEK